MSGTIKRKVLARGDRVRVSNGMRYGQTGEIYALRDNDIYLVKFPDLKSPQPYHIVELETK